MKKSIALIGIFVLLAAVALVYGVQYFGAPGTAPGSARRWSPGPVSTVDPSTVPTVLSAADSQVQFEWKLGNTYLLKNGSGDVYLDLRVSGKPQPNQKRRAMNLVLVIDRSGSMGSENKLEQVKGAATQIVNNMNPTDRLAVVIYDDTVQTILPSSPVENKSRINEVISSLTPGGSTNLHGGLMQGYEEARRNFRQDSVNRIILLSDGLANVGVVEPNQINASAQQIRQHSVSVSTMGVGLDYNEDLMANIADNSGGNYYFINTDMNMAEVFSREWNLMQSLVATDGIASLRLGDGVSVADVAGYKWDQNGQNLTIHVPDIYSGQTRRILVELKAPAASIGTIHLADGSFVCTELKGDTHSAFSAKFTPVIRVIEDRTLVAKNADRNVQEKAAANIASRKMEEAYRLYESGEQDMAYEMAQQSATELKSLGYAGNAAQVKRYDEALKVMAPSPAQPAPDSKDGKLFLKKQKEAERNTQQADPQ